MALKGRLHEFGEKNWLTEASRFGLVSLASGLFLFKLTRLADRSETLRSTGTLRSINKNQRNLRLRLIGYVIKNTCIEFLSK
jgi:hypothetical protein